MFIFLREKLFFCFCWQGEVSLLKLNNGTQRHLMGIKTFLMRSIYPHRHVTCLSNVICHIQMQWPKVIMAYFQQYPNVTHFNICIMIHFLKNISEKGSFYQPRWGAYGSWITEGSEPLSKIVLLQKWNHSAARGDKLQGQREGENKKRMVWRNEGR